MVQVLSGTGTAELTSCLNMSILAMGNVKKFRDGLPIGLQQHQTLHVHQRQDEFTCVRSVLNAIIDDLSGPSKKQIESVSLTLLMNALAKCWSGHKDLLMVGRNYAAKVFELILKLLHDCYTVCGVNTAESCHCLPHILYSIEVKSYMLTFLFPVLSLGKWKVFSFYFRNFGNRTFQQRKSFTGQTRRKT